MLRAPAFGVEAWLIYVAHIWRQPLLLAPPPNPQLCAAQASLRLSSGQLIGAEADNCSFY